MLAAALRFGDAEYPLLRHEPLPAAAMRLAKKPAGTDPGGQRSPFK
jgi:hypothetical protein